MTTRITTNARITTVRPIDGSSDSESGTSGFSGLGGWVDDGAELLDTSKGSIRLVDADALGEAEGVVERVKVVV